MDGCHSEETWVTTPANEPTPGRASRDGLPYGDPETAEDDGPDPEPDFLPPYGPREVTPDQADDNGVRPR